MKKALGTLFGVIVLLCAIGIGYRMMSRSDSGASSESADRIPEGHEARYAFQIETRVKTKGEGEAVLLSLNGTLQQTQQNAADTLTEWAEISRFVTNGKDMDAATLASMLHQPFITTREVDNSLSYFISEKFPAALAAMQLNFLQKLFLPIDVKSTDPVLVNEKDESGFFSVRYDFKPAGERIAVNRTFVQALSGNRKVDANENTLRYLFEKDGRLVRVEGDFTLHVFEPKAQSYHTRLSVVLKGSEPADEAKVKLAKDGLKHYDIGGRVIAGGDSDQPQLSMAEALKAVDTFTANATPAEDFTTFSALTNALHKDPSQLPLVVDKVLSIKDRDENSKRQLTMLFTVLADSDSKPGSEALTDLAGPKCPDAYCKDQAMMAYNFHSNPSDISATKMIEIAETTTDPELSSTAFLAAGSAGAKLPSASAELSEALLASVNNPEKAEIKTAIIAAMGNHASPQYIPVLKEGTASEDYKIRAASVYSLRNIPDESVNAMILGTLAKETEIFGQKEALKALGSRNLTAKDYDQVALKGVGYQEDVQTDAARLLLDTYFQNPTLVQGALETLKNGSQFKDVKLFIDEEMQRAQSGSSESPAPGAEGSDNPAE